MERAETYQFDDEEIHILSEALAMYAGYMKEMELNMLVGNESDSVKIATETHKAESMARDFFNEDGNDWSSEGVLFQEIHDRPMDMNDVSKFDWFEYVRGED